MAMDRIPRVGTQQGTLAATGPIRALENPPKKRKYYRKQNKSPVSTPSDPNIPHLHTRAGALRMYFPHLCSIHIYISMIHHL